MQIGSLFCSSPWLPRVLLQVRNQATGPFFLLFFLPGTSIISSSKELDIFSLLSFPSVIGVQDSCWSGLHLSNFSLSFKYDHDIYIFQAVFAFSPLAHFSQLLFSCIVPMHDCGVNFDVSPYLFFTLCVIFHPLLPLIGPCFMGYLITWQFIVSCSWRGLDWGDFNARLGSLFDAMDEDDGITLRHPKDEGKDSLDGQPFFHIALFMLLPSSVFQIPPLTFTLPAHF